MYCVVLCVTQGFSTSKSVWLYNPTMILLQQWYSVNIKKEISAEKYRCSLAFKPYWECIVSASLSPYAVTLWKKAENMASGDPKRFLPGVFIWRAKVWLVARLPHRWRGGQLQHRLRTVKGTFLTPAWWSVGSKSGETWLAEGEKEKHQETADRIDSIYTAGIHKWEITMWRTTKSS